MTSTVSKCTWAMLRNFYTSTDEEASEWTELVAIHPLSLRHMLRPFAMHVRERHVLYTWIGWEPRLVQGMETVRRFAKARSTATGSPSNKDIKSSSRLYSTTFPPDRDALRSDPSLPAALLTKRLRSFETIGVNSLSISAQIRLASELFGRATYF